MIGFIIWSLFGVFIIGLGIKDMFSKNLVGFWANTETIKVKDVKGYNRATGRLFIIYGIVFIILGIGQAQVAEYKANDDLFIRDNKVIIKMRPEYERSETTEPFWGLFGKNLGTTERAKKELKELIGENGFETVKPVEILRRLIYHSTEKDDIILDFFSGSATTAHAVIQLNAEDGGHGTVGRSF